MGEWSIVLNRQPLGKTFHYCRIADLRKRQSHYMRETHLTKTWAINNDKGNVAYSEVNDPKEFEVWDDQGC